MTAKELVGTRLLMSDFFRWRPTANSIGYPAWIYNHGKFGWSCLYEGYVDWGWPNPAAATGLNELFGDGRVVWKHTSTMDLELLETLPDYLEFHGMVNSGDGGGPKTVY